MESTHTVGILALPVIHVRSVNHVRSIDEKLRGPHDLEEVPRALHFSQKFDKQLRAGVRVDALHEANQPTDKTIARWWDCAICLYRWVRAVLQRRDRRAAECSSSPTGLSSVVVGLAVCYHTHRDKHDSEVDEDGPVC
jgi:hypothetical protein